MLSRVYDSTSNLICNTFTLDIVTGQKVYEDFREKGMVLSERSEEGCN